MEAYLPDGTVMTDDEGYGSHGNGTAPIVFGGSWAGDQGQWFKGNMSEFWMRNDRPSSAYNAALNASGRDNLLAFGAIIEGVVPPIGTTDAATAVTTTTATLNGTVTDLGDAASLVVSFDYGETLAYGSNAVAAESPMNAPGTCHADIAGLNPGTLYHCRLKMDGSGSGGSVAYGGDVMFTTDSYPSVLSCLSKRNSDIIMMAS